MSVVVRAVYHENDVDSTAAAYRIGICVKNWVRQSAAHVDFEPMVDVVRCFTTAVAAKAYRFVVGMRHSSSK